jgi:hypothetical protein
MRIRCCSFSISPQTHKSFGSPHVVQTSAMTLTVELAVAVYKSFKAVGCRLLCDFWSIPPLYIVSRSGLR